MKKQFTYPLLLAFALLIQSCATPQYFHDEMSYKRQKELQTCRSTNVCCEILMGVGSVFFAAATDGEITYIPSDQQFKKIKLKNTTADTMYVNMLTDLIWDKDDYCDFMDIRIPPHLECKVLVPVNANYNLYYSNTPKSEDDELLEIFTGNVKTIYLYPGLTASDTLK